jgi:TfoX/Sxy family transcriptional regulator of competence genes
MVYDETLATRIRTALVDTTGLEEKKMFGGVGFMLHGNMACEVLDDSLEVRVGIENYEEALMEPHVKVFDFTGKPMKGWVIVRPKGLRTEEELREWLHKGIDFTLNLPAK